MKFQSLFALAALGSGTLAFPAFPSYFSKWDSSDITSSYPTKTKGGFYPTGVFPTGADPTEGFPTGIRPTGSHHTGYSKHTSHSGTGHAKPVQATDKPILPRHKSHAHPSAGFPVASGSLPPMPSDATLLSSLEMKHGSGPFTTEPFSMEPHPTGGPMYRKRDASVPYPSESQSDAQKSDDCSTGKIPHKTGSGHKTGTHPRPTGVHPTGVHPTGTHPTGAEPSGASASGKPEGYPKYTK